MFLSRWRIQKERYLQKENPYFPRSILSLDPLLFLFESKSRRGTGTGGHEIRDHRCLIESAPIPQREMDTGGCSISSLSDQTRTTHHFPPHGRISSSSGFVQEPSLITAITWSFCYVFPATWPPETWTLDRCGPSGGRSTWKMAARP